MKNEINEEIIGISNYLRERFNPHSIVLFGSYARGDYKDLSDIDILVITDSYLKISDINKNIPKSIKSEKISIVTYPLSDFNELFNEGSLFIAHLIREGKILFDDGSYEKIAKRDFKVSDEFLNEQIRIQINKLALYQDLSRFNNIHINCLDHFFAIFKNIVLLSLAKKGLLEFNKEKAFQLFKSKFSKHTEAIEKLMELQNFHILSSKGLKRELPFNYIGDLDKVEACRSILIDVVEGIRNDK